ncbi:MAG: anaerobic glycerol-3-phosphate dehydrogenase subunit C [Candidatus Rokubacteria bacterium]|nr:anaerobic glycerol-3-phosphate dehydrogenase subunit C [Candidatus Rokubacteria bacterium]
MGASISITAPSPAAKARHFWGRVAAGRDNGPPPHPDLKGLAALRRRVVEDLGALAERFESALARAAGVSVTRAATPAEAAEVVATLAGPGGRVALNRSGALATEVRPALESRGLLVVDSYGEAARGANPAGLPGSFPGQAADIAGSFEAEPWREAAAAPRRDEVAVLGVSVAVAEDGALHFLQHFSNISRLLDEARAVVLVVPLEKIVPTAADAALQLRAMAVHGLLPAMAELSARGAAAGPPCEEPPRAPGTERPTLHVLLLDNGRLALARGEHRALLECIGCRACVAVCPTQRFFGGPARQNPREYALGRCQGRVDDVDLCVLCTMCQHACPLDIAIPRSLAVLKGEDGRRRGPSLERLVLGNPAVLGRCAAPLAPLANLTLTLGPARALMERCAGIAAERPLPPFARESLAARFDARRPAPAPTARAVAYFPGCYANWHAPGIGEALVRVLERNGIRVTLPTSGCCGIPNLANGRREAALREARAVLRTLEPIATRGGEIVTACTTCHFVLSRVYRDLVGVEAEAVASRVRDASDFLLGLHAAGRLDTAALGPLRLKVGHHTPCHARADGLSGRSPALMRLIPGVEVEEVERGCCGMAGTFGMKREHYARSMEIGAAVFRGLSETGAPVATTDCPTCTMQIAHGTTREVVHPVVLLDRAYAAGHGDE